ncbi:MAG: hypothetical protein ABI397_01305 [Candidatus Saccharimonas sp.]
MSEIHSGLSPHERGALEVRDALRGGRPLRKGERGPELVVAQVMALDFVPLLERVFVIMRNRRNTVDPVLLDGRIITPEPGTINEDGEVTTYHEMSDMVKRAFAKVAEIQIGHEFLVAEVADYEMRAEIARQKDLELLARW